MPRRWAKGGFTILGSYGDLLLDERANRTVSDFVRERIREKIDDPALADELTPTGYPFGAKRPCLDTGYFETFNRPNVSLVDLRGDPLREVTPTGVRTAGGHHELDAIVLATGFDAMTGALTRIDIKGRDGSGLADRWAGGPRTYLGLGVAGFPNMFLLVGPGSPSVLVNMVTASEQHGDWVANCLRYMDERGLATVEATPEAEQGWVDEANAVAEQTVYPSAASWFRGDNMPGKPKTFMPYAGGFPRYEKRCDEVAAGGYVGFRFE
ncbi:hypothetical protein [Saccharopolyspora sp. NPDC050642]|uniref:flavin-containing monooxygenase n=1 Tax=Saccharopolyspora sp. NPDC050642 TaxID=3157099 RepID=UPI0033FC3F84